jgi:hypothetical protein
MIEERDRKLKDAIHREEMIRVLLIKEQNENNFLRELHGIPPQPNIPPRDVYRESEAAEVLKRKDQASTSGKNEEVVVDDDDEEEEEEIFL